MGSPNGAVRRYRVSGHVQGVFFRASAREQGRALGLDGWVRNLADGTVEAVFAGPADRVEEMIVACHQGSPASRVTAVRRQPATEDDLRGEGFGQLPTI